LTHISYFKKQISKLNRLSNQFHDMISDAWSKSRPKSRGWKQSRSNSFSSNSTRI